MASSKAIITGLIGMTLVIYAAYSFWEDAGTSAPPVITGAVIPEFDSWQRITCVVDGESLWLHGINYRLAGYDTPEEHTDICGGDTEIDLARAATRRFVELLKQNAWELQLLGRAGNNGRALANTYVNGADVGDILVGERLAHYWPDGDEFWCE